MEEGRTGSSDWTAAAAQIHAELREVRLRFDADWAVVWGPLPIYPTTPFASVLFEDKDPSRSSSALGIAVPIAGNAWAESIFEHGGAITDDATHDPRHRVTQWVLSHNHIVSMASGAALNEGSALAVVELYSQRRLTLPPAPIFEIQQVAQRIAALLACYPAPDPLRCKASVPADRIAAAALHDLKSALAAQALLITSFEKDLRAVAGGARPDPSRLAGMLESLSVMRESVTHASELTRVMTLGTLAPGTRVPIDLPALAKLSLAAIPLDLRERFDAKTDPTIIVARPVSDAPSILRAIVNLVQNAALAIQRVKGARATIEVRSEGDMGIVDVEDQGAGVSPDLVPKLFQPGVTSRDPPDGHGFGLYSAREAIEALGGTLALYNVPRHGARFTIRLPRAVAGV